MKTKKILGIVMLSLCLFSFTGCENEDERKITDYREYVLTLASHKIPGVLTAEGRNYLTNVYAVKTAQSDEWKSLGSIGGFDFEEGYEYEVKISETDYLDYRMGQPAWTERNLLELLSKEKKSSEGLPLHFIPEWYYTDRFMPEYRYAVDADNKEVIEEDLKNNPIMPLNYHYMLWRSEDSFIRWIAIKDDSDTLGPCIIKSENKDSEKIPEYYKLLPPEGNVNESMMGWSFLDEEGNETNYPSFDVFVGHSAKSKSVNLTPNKVYLYKELTEHYKNKYTEAGVKAVVVSFALSLQ